jgi:hypothetical protein
VSSAGSLIPTSSAAFAQAATGGHGEGLAELAFEAGFGEERGETAVERGIDRADAGTGSGPWRRARRAGQPQPDRRRWSRR